MGGAQTLALALAEAPALALAEALAEAEGLAVAMPAAGGVTITPAVADLPNATSGPPVKAQRSGVSTRKCPVTVTVICVP